MAVKMVNLQNINTEIECSVKVLNKTICLKWTNLQEEICLLKENLSIKTRCLFIFPLPVFRVAAISGQLVSIYYWKKNRKRALTKQRAFPESFYGSLHFFSALSEGKRVL